MPPSAKREQADLVKGLAEAKISLAFAWRDSPTDWFVQRVPIMDDLADSFRAIAIAAATDLHDNRTEVPYDPEWPLKPHEFFAIPNARPKPPVGGNLFPRLDNFGQASVYGTSRRRSNPNLYIILAQLPDASIAMFGRRITARNLLDSKRWIRAIWTEQTFSELSGPVITFDPHTDWIDWRNTLLVLNANEFHVSFRNVAELAQAVQGHIDSIAQHIPIINASKMVERCRSMVGMASKLQSIVEQQLYLKPIDELKSYTSKYAELGVEWRDDSLVFDDALEHQWAILKLFDEAGYTGDLSGEKFEAAAKRAL
jgi:hypothetical protein